MSETGGREGQRENIMQGWKTVLANALAIGLAWLNSAVGVVDLTGDEQAAAVVTLLAVVNLILRAVTKTPIGQAE